MLKAKDFRKMARESLKGSWLLAVGAGLIASLLGGCIITTGGGGGTAGGETAATESGSLKNAANGLLAGGAITDIFFAGATIAVVMAVIYLIATLIIGGAVSMGYAKFNMNLINRTGPDIKDMFSEMGRFKAGFVMQFLRFLYVLLWSFLFVIPGIIASYSYKMAPYILMENPDMTASQAIAASKKLMEGNKWRLFCLEFSFIGWSLLASITLGIGMLFLRPYMEAAGAAFYRELKWESKKAEAGME